MSILCTSSNFRQKQHVNGQNPAKRVYKIWRKNFQALPNKQILRVLLGHFLSRTLYATLHDRYVICRRCNKHRRTGQFYSRELSHLYPKIFRQCPKKLISYFAKLLCPTHPTQ